MLIDRYYPGAGSNVIFRSVYQLPDDLTCTQCVLQWRYVAGNNWGNCPDGAGRVGCGPQEEFRGCADVKITEDGVPDVTTPPTSASSSTTARPRTRGTVTSRYTRPTKPTTTDTTTASTASSTTTTSTTTTESPEFNEIPHDRYGSVDPGTYVGIIIALATLLFAILLILGLILYFYHCHRDVKGLVRKHWAILRERMTDEPELPHKLPASVFASQPLPSVTSEVKPPVPPRAKRHANHANLRLLSLTISEPLDVAINGVSVSRDGMPASGAEEADVSTA